MKLKDIAVDVDAMSYGVWVECRGGWHAKVRSSANPHARTMSDRQLKRNRPIYRKNDIPSWELRDQNTLELLVECCLADWRGVEESDGNGGWVEIPFSKARAYEILGDPQYRQMLDDVADAAGMDETFRAAAREADEKN